MSKYSEINDLAINILRVAPLNASHLKVDSGVFVRMGQAKLDGYISLNDLRRALSVKLVRTLTKDEIKEILDNADSRAVAYSLKAKHYLGIKMSDFVVLGPVGYERQITSHVDMLCLVYIDQLKIQLSFLEQHTQCWAVVGD